MATTLTNLKYTRFVRQVSNGAARSKYSYRAMQTDLLNALKFATWRKASSSANEVTTVANKVSETDAVFDQETGEQISPPSYTAFLDDRYDAYKQGGDANRSNATMCGYAGMVAYRFKLPENYASTGPISSVSMRLSSSRYLRSGLRVAIGFSQSAEPSADWYTIRGETTNHTPEKNVTESIPNEDPSATVKSWGALNQQSAATLMQSRSGETTLTFSPFKGDAVGSGTSYAYMFVYVSVEDYEDIWDAYNDKEPRYYSIEGSGTLVGGSVSITFNGAVSEIVDAYYTATPAALARNKYGMDTAISSLGKSELGVWADAGNVIMYYDAVNVGNARKSWPLTLITAYQGCAKTKFISDSVAPLSDGNMLVADAGHICTPRQNLDEDYQSDTYTKKFNRDGFGVFTISNDAMLYDAGLMVYFKAVVVPTGLDAYTSLKMSLPAGKRVYSSISYDLAVWRTRSAAALGMYSLPALSALATNKHFALATKDRVSITASGSGTVSTNVSLSIDADLVALERDPFTTTGPSTVEFSLRNPVEPGDLLVIMPIPRNVQPQTEYSITTTPQLIMLDTAEASVYDGYTLALGEYMLNPVVSLR